MPLRALCLASALASASAFMPTQGFLPKSATARSSCYEAQADQRFAAAFLRRQFGNNVPGHTTSRHPFQFKFFSSSSFQFNLSSSSFFFEQIPLFYRDRSTRDFLSKLAAMT